MMPNTDAVERCTKCRATPAESNVLWDCLPVPCFGNPGDPKVQVATISLNPSSLEFYDETNHVKDMKTRLPMARDFGVQDRRELSDEALQRARAVRDRYFQNKPHAWFTPMQMVLRGMNPLWSYAEGTAVQIDVIACATTPRYGDVSDAAKKVLTDNCRPYLQQTFFRIQPGTFLVINGSGAFSALDAAVKLVPNDFTTQLRIQKQVKVYVGRCQAAGKEFRYFGWNLYLHREPLGLAGAIIDYWNTLPPDW